MLDGGGCGVCGLLVAAAFTLGTFGAVGTFGVATDGATDGAADALGVAEGVAGGGANTCVGAGGVVAGGSAVAVGAGPPLECVSFHAPPPMIARITIGAAKMIGEGRRSRAGAGDVSRAAPRSVRAAAS